MRVGCRRIIAGPAEGEVLRTVQPINFLTSVDLKSGTVQDPKHELHEKAFPGKILIFPNSIGSSVGAYSIYALKKNGVAPRGMICRKADITTSSGCAISNIPLVDRINLEISEIRTGAHIRFGENEIEID